MTALVAYLLIFAFVGFFFVWFHLMLGKLVRPAKPSPEKLEIYECGEPTIGSAWIQFDLRFYVVALLFVIFDVEVAFFFPWAVVFGKSVALADNRLEPNERQELTQALVPGAAAGSEPVQPGAAKRLSWIALIDILVFFGVLLVGYAYLWKRGDLDWVRSTAAERAQEQLAARPPPESSQRQLVEIG
jgi:NADH-quinone oxidoreductase subunit A